MKQIIYYTCNTHKDEIDQLCRGFIKDSGLHIVTVSLNRGLDFGDTVLAMAGKKGPLRMHKQILYGLESSVGDYIFLCESDVIYHPSHFDFVPPRNDTFYYNNNVWKMRWDDKFTFRTDDMKQVSGICAHRDLLLDFYQKRVKQIENIGFNRHYEPGLKQSVGSQKVDTWDSKQPNVCIRHDQNITKSKFSPKEFKNPRYAEGWREGKVEWIDGLI